MVTQLSPAVCIALALSEAGDHGNTVERVDWGGATHLVASREQRGRNIHIAPSQTPPREPSSTSHSHPLIAHEAINTLTDSCIYEVIVLVSQ